MSIATTRGRSKYKITFRMPWGGGEGYAFPHRSVLECDHRTAKTIAAALAATPGVSEVKLSEGRLVFKET